ncbi:MAG: hypothetical protein ONB31_13980 [candidate division KSB1 bacterium]|nr:hypothetical protein [candidate division KSB1 bacterium]MDZ7335741.1 hypothetical protein [candidate division KSB1 bacterium]MDZ7357508.1 hypothetical protein [candidate division KSB1 bacterium]MDZ7402091.1 hypothetical protein [candidate division KSB1 bacterium]
MTNQQPKQTLERFNQLLMGAIDQELTPQEWNEFNQIVNSNRQLLKEWKHYKKLKEVARAMKFKSPPKEVWDNYWMNTYNKIERGIGWIIFSIGAIILITYGLFKAVESMIADPKLQGIIKIGIIAVLLGLVILLVSVIREKLFVRKSDPYKEVQR